MVYELVILLKPTIKWIWNTFTHKCQIKWEFTFLNVHIRRKCTPRIPKYTQNVEIPCLTGNLRGPILLGLTLVHVH